MCIDYSWSCLGIYISIFLKIRNLYFILKKLFRYHYTVFGGIDDNVWLFPLNPSLTGLLTASPGQGELTNRPSHPQISLWMDMSHFPIPSQQHNFVRFPDWVFTSPLLGMSMSLHFSSLPSIARWPRHACWGGVGLCCDFANVLVGTSVNFLRWVILFSAWQLCNLRSCLPYCFAFSLILFPHLQISFFGTDGLKFLYCTCHAWQSPFYFDW